MPTASDFSPIVVSIIGPGGVVVEGVEVQLTNIYSEDGTPQVGSRPHIIRIDDDTLYVAYDGGYRDGGVYATDNGESVNAETKLWIAKPTYCVSSYDIPESSGVPEASDGGGFSGRTPGNHWYATSGGFSGRTPPQWLGLKNTLDTPVLDRQHLLQRPLELTSAREPLELVATDYSSLYVVMRTTDDCFWCGNEQDTFAVPSMLAQATRVEQVDFPGRSVGELSQQNRYLSTVARRLGGK